MLTPSTAARAPGGVDRSRTSKRRATRDGLREMGAGVALSSSICTPLTSTVPMVVMPGT